MSCGPNGAWRLTPAVAVVSSTAWLLHAAPLVSRSVKSSELAGSACWNCRRQLPALPARKVTPGSAGAHSAHWPFHSSGMSRLGIGGRAVAQSRECHANATRCLGCARRALARRDNSERGLGQIRRIGKFFRQICEGQINLRPKSSPSPSPRNRSAFALPSRGAAIRQALAAALSNNLSFSAWRPPAVRRQCPPTWGASPPS